MSTPTKQEKMVEKSKEETRELRTIREAHIMMLLRHPHIVRLKSFVAVGHYFYILMDYVNGGQLLHYIVKRQKLTEDIACHFSRQIVSALDYMHRNSIVHRDLKIENILIDRSGKNIKIIDFGLSNLFCPERRLTTYCGSLYFAAPELLMSKPYRGPEVDVWSLGVVIFVMVTGSVPFDDKSMSGLHEKIKRGQVVYPSYLSAECRNLLSRIFVTDPSKRIKLADVMRHPWINSGYQTIPNNYLLLRPPIDFPLSSEIIQKMTNGFNLGSTENIMAKMEMIVSSPVYRKAAEHVYRIQSAEIPKVTISQSLNYSLWGAYDDTQTVPAAYHPLLSLYHLTRERLSDIREREVYIPDNMASPYLYSEPNVGLQLCHDSTATDTLVMSPSVDSPYATYTNPINTDTDQQQDTQASFDPSVDNTLFSSSETTRVSSQDQHLYNHKSKEKPAKRFDIGQILNRSTAPLSSLFTKMMCTR
jgi:serine/threonine protein kinase